MLIRIFIAFIALLTFCCLGHAEDTTIKTDWNEFTVSYYHRAGMQMLPHGAIDQAKDSAIALYGTESLFSFDRGFYIGSDSFGYVAYKIKDGVNIFLVACSKGNFNSMTVTGVCKKGDWRFELIKLLELSIKELDKLDSFNVVNK